MCTDHKRSVGLKIKLAEWRVLKEVSIFSHSFKKINKQWTIYMNWIGDSFLENTARAINPNRLPSYLKKHLLCSIFQCLASVWNLWNTLTRVRNYCERSGRRRKEFRGGWHYKRFTWNCLGTLWLFLYHLVWCYRVARGYPTSGSTGNRPWKTAPESQFFYKARDNHSGSG